MGLRAVANPLAGSALPPNVTSASLNSITPTGGTLAVTGSVSATGQVSASAFATTGYDASGYSAQLLLAGNSTANNFATFIASNGAGRTYYMGPGSGDGQVASFALYDNTAGATRWRSTATGFDVTGSISASTGVSLGVNAPLQFTAGSGTAPYLQHTSNTLDVKQGTSGLRVLNNAGTVALIGMTDGTTTQMSVTGSISATDYLAGAEQTPPSAPAANGYRIFAQDNGAGKTQLMVIFATGAAQQIAIEP